MDERVRELLSKLDGATDEARLTLAQLGLPAALDALKPGKAEIPDDVRAALSDEFIASGGILNLQVPPFHAYVCGNAYRQMADIATPVDHSTATSRHL